MPKTRRSNLRRHLRTRRLESSKPRLDTVFECLNCNRGKTVHCKCDFGINIGTLQCDACKYTFSTSINHLSREVDVFSDWVDACEALNPDGKFGGAGPTIATTSERADAGAKAPNRIFKENPSERQHKTLIFQKQEQEEDMEEHKDEEDEEEEELPVRHHRSRGYSQDLTAAPAECHGRHQPPTLTLGQNHAWLEPSTLVPSTQAPDQRYLSHPIQARGRDQTPRTIPPPLQAPAQVRARVRAQASALMQEQARLHASSAVAVPIEAQSESQTHLQPQGQDPTSGSNIFRSARSRSLDQASARALARARSKSRERIKELDQTDIQLLGLGRARFLPSSVKRDEVDWDYSVLRDGVSATSDHPQRLDSSESYYIQNQDNGYYDDVKKVDDGKCDMIAADREEHHIHGRDSGSSSGVGPAA